MIFGVENKRLLLWNIWPTELLQSYTHQGKITYSELLVIYVIYSKEDSFVFGIQMHRNDCHFINKLYENSSLPCCITW